MDQREWIAATGAWPYVETAWSDELRRPWFISWEFCDHRVVIGTPGDRFVTTMLLVQVAEEYVPRVGAVLGRVLLVDNPGGSQAWRFYDAFEFWDGVHTRRLERVWKIDWTASDFGPEIRDLAEQHILHFIHALRRKHHP